MNRSTTTPQMPTDVRDRLVNLILTDSESSGKPLLPPEDVGPLLAWLERVLLDWNAFTEHRSLLEEHFHAFFRTPGPSRDRREDDLTPLPGENPGFRHFGELPAISP